MRHIITVSAIVTVMMLISVAMIPSVEAAEEPQYTPTDGLIDDIRNNVGVGILIGMETEWALGNTILDLIGFGKRSSPYAGSSDEVKKFAQKISMSDTADAMSVLTGTVSVLVDNNTQTWAIAQQHLNRSAEISAGSKWAPDTIYDPATILQNASVYALLANGMYNTSYALDYGYNELGDGMIRYWSGNDWSSGITTSIVWTGGSMTSKSQLTMNMASIVTADQDNGRVYISSASPTDGKMTVWTDVGGTISSLDGTAQRILQPGKNEIEALPDGLYRLSQGTWAGQFLPYAVTSDQQDHAVVVGGAVISNVDSFAFVTVNGDGLRIVQGSKSSESPDLRYRYSASENTYESSVLKGVKAYSEQIATMSDCIVKAAVAGQVMWTISAKAGSANILLSPSSISPDLVNLGFNAEQSYALYVSALSQISTYYSSYGEILKAGQVKISAESLDLYCYGTIYAADGTVIAEKAVFTPYVNIHSMTVTRGAFNTFGESGTIMVWDTGLSGLEAFKESDVRSHTAVIMPEGSYFTPSEMRYGGEDVQSVKLTVKEISRTEGLDSIVRDEIVQPKQLRAGTLIMIIMLELACIIAMAGYLFRIPYMFIAATIVGLLGLFIPDLIAKWIVGLL